MSMMYQMSKTTIRYATSDSFPTPHNILLSKVKKSANDINHNLEERTGDKETQEVSNIVDSDKSSLKFQKIEKSLTKMFQAFKTTRHNLSEDQTLSIINKASSNLEGLYQYFTRSKDQSSLNYQHAESIAFSLTYFAALSLEIKPCKLVPIVKVASWKKNVSISKIRKSRSFKMVQTVLRENSSSLIN